MVKVMALSLNDLINVIRRLLNESTRTSFIHRKRWNDSIGWNDGIVLNHTIVLEDGESANDTVLSDHDVGSYRCCFHNCILTDMHIIPNLDRIVAKDSVCNEKPFN